MTEDVFGGWGAAGRWRWLRSRERLRQRVLARGAVYVYRRNGSSWNFEAYLKATNPRLGGQFGFSVCTTGNIIAIGANLEDSSGSDPNDGAAQKSGAACVYAWDGANWQATQRLKASNLGDDDQFGTAIGCAGTESSCSL